MNIQQLFFRFSIPLLLVISPSLFAASPAYPCLSDNRCITYKGHYYQQYTFSKTWTMASNACQSLTNSYYKAHLVTITSIAEKDFLTAAMTNIKTHWVANLFNWIDGRISMQGNSSYNINYTNNVESMSLTNVNFIGNTGIKLSNYSAMKANISLDALYLDGAKKTVNAGDKTKYHPYICEIETK